MAIVITSNGRGLGQAIDTSESTTGLVGAGSTLLEQPAFASMSLMGVDQEGLRSPVSRSDTAGDYASVFQAADQVYEHDFITIARPDSFTRPIRCSTNWLPACGHRQFKRFIEPMQLWMVPQSS